MTKINFTEKDVPRSLPEDFRKHSIEYLERINESIHSNKSDQNRQKTENEINFIFRLIVDDRMIPVWRKLFEMNPEKTLILFPASISLIYFDLSFFNKFDQTLIKYHLAPSSLFDMKPTIRALESMAHLCKDLLTTSKFHTLYTTEFDFEEYDKNSLIGESEHHHFTDEVKNYLTRLEQVLSYHKSNLDETEAASFLANPTSRKRSIDNAEALLWAKRLKVIILRFYKKPLNKEIGTMVSALFPEDERLYDEDYIAKITKEVAKILKKSEDSL